MVARKFFAVTFGLLVLYFAENACAEPSPSWVELASESSPITINWIQGKNLKTASVTFSFAAETIWSYDGNITPQSPAHIESVIEDKFGLGSTALTNVSNCSNNCSGYNTSSGSFSSTKSFDYIAIHFGQGELFIKSESPLNSFSIGGLPRGLSNIYTYTAVSAVPEPTEGVMLLSGIGLLGFIAARRKLTRQKSI